MQNVNFVISTLFIAVFGFFMTVTVVQALNKDAPILKHIASPIELQS